MSFGVQFSHFLIVACHRSILSHRCRQVSLPHFIRSWYANVEARRRLQEVTKLCSPRVDEAFRSLF
ncbi:hypothetical protein VFPFJ_05983 [Purpureocillium lilacinum]|uniref:Uncharacterized protein n=1 Tax=Purpureocillium lilacinum TaxID=33203 RepID=A0A179H629_PURLI|nr:hypothetical protein VFPFJ_05983 [Purpureocillium lilacinum]OAQ85021.1 hypothetical protein VFPBJ_03794 [Purpureocillium lilacinum]OAQ89569.1 hypothetical protein VFPFJ_05983 [Purpureocillium lilacinum]